MNRKWWSLVAVAAVIWVAVFVAFLALVLKPSAPTPATQEQASSVAYSAAEQRYLSNLHAEGVHDKPDRTLVSTGHIVCNDIDNGADAGMEAHNLRMQGWSMWSASAVVARAVLDLCLPR
ncbi:MAG: DUF732 domain-containing protein [Actinomycetota bacterium]|nr:DUF732 domain-containing protein [Actinomycetota bacterium]